MTKRAHRRRAVQSARDARKRTGRNLLDMRNPTTRTFLARLADEAAAEVAARRAAKIPIVPLSVLWPAARAQRRKSVNGRRAVAIDEMLR
jgi:hypothetical protein